MDKDWQPVWLLPNKPDSMEHCTLKCPMLKVELTDEGALSIGTHSPSDPKEDVTFSCKRLKRKWERLHWDGKTFEPVKS